MLHYLELFDLLQLETVRLVGLSLGGWIAESRGRSSAFDWKVYRISARISLPTFALNDSSLSPQMGRRPGEG